MGPYLRPTFSAAMLLIEILLILALVAWQAYVFWHNRQLVARVAAMYPAAGAVAVQPIAFTAANPEKNFDVQYDALMARDAAPEFGQIITDTNEYLLNNRGAAADFGILKDISERHAEALDDLLHDPLGDLAVLGAELGGQRLRHLGPGVGLGLALHLDGLRLGLSLKQVGLRPAACLLDCPVGLAGGPDLGGLGVNGRLLAVALALQDRGLAQHGLVDALDIAGRHLVHTDLHLIHVDAVQPLQLGLHGDLQLGQDLLPALARDLGDGVAGNHIAQFQQDRGVVVALQVHVAGATDLIQQLIDGAGRDAGGDGNLESDGLGVLGQRVHLG